MKCMTTTLHDVKNVPPIVLQFEGKKDPIQKSEPTSGLGQAKGINTSQQLQVEKGGKDEVLKYPKKRQERGKTTGINMGKNSNVEVNDSALTNTNTTHNMDSTTSGANTDGSFTHKTMAKYLQL